MTFTGTPADDAAAPLGPLSVTPYGTKYLPASSSDVLDTRIRAWIADTPEGPWTYLGVVTTEVVQQGLRRPRRAADRRRMDSRLQRERRPAQHGRRQVVPGAVRGS